MKKYIFLLILLLMPLSVFSQDRVLPITDFKGGLFTRYDPSLIPDNCSPDLLNLTFENGVLEKRKGSSKVCEFATSISNTFTITTQADWEAGETHAVDSSSSPGTISLLSVSDSWTQGSLSDFDNADSRVNIDSTTIYSVLTVANVDIASDTNSAVATCSDSSGASNSPALAIDRDTGTYYSGIDTYTVLLIHADGINGGTTFGDSSAYHRALTTVDGAKIDAVNYVFGTGSCTFDGALDDVTAANDPAWVFGTAPFTIEFWVRFNDVVSTSYFMSARANTGWAMWVASREITFYAGAEAFTTSGSLLNTATWYHIAIEKTSSGTAVIFVNGSPKYRVNKSAVSVDGDQTFKLASYAGNYIKAGFDEIRISKGIARWDYDTTFTVPISPYVIGTDGTFWISNASSATHTLQVTLNDTVLIGSAGWSNLNSTASPNNFDIQYSIDNSTWNTAVATINLPDTTTWTDSFTPVAAKFWRVLIYGTEQFYIEEFYLMPCGRYVSQGNTDSDIVNGLARTFTASDTDNSFNVDYYLRTDEDIINAATWSAVTKNSDLLSTLKKHFQVKVELYPMFTGMGTIKNPSFDTFTLNYQYRVALIGQFVSQKIDRGNYTLNKFTFTTVSDSSPNGTIAYYVRHAKTSSEVNTATWCNSVTIVDSSFTTPDRYVQLRADLCSNSVNTTPYVYSLQVVSYDSMTAGAMRGLGTFYTKAGNKYIWCAYDGNVKLSLDGITWTTMISGLQPSANVEGAVFMDTLWLVNGIDNDYSISNILTVNSYTFAFDAALNISAGIPAGKYIDVFNNRLIIANTTNNPSRIWFSEITYPESFPAENYVDIQPFDGDEITAIKKWKGDLYIGKKYLSAIMADNFTWKILSPSIGILSNRSCAVSDNSIIMPSLYNIYGLGYGFQSIQGSSYSNLSENIEPIYQNYRQSQAQKGFWLTTSQDDWQAGETKTNIDTGSYLASGNVAITRKDTEILNYGFELNNLTYWLNPSSFVITGSAKWGTYCAYKNLGAIDYNLPNADQIELAKQFWATYWRWYVVDSDDVTITSSTNLWLSAVYPSWYEDTVVLSTCRGKNVKVRLELVNYYGAMIVCITTDLFLSNGQNWRVAALGNGQSSLITSQFRYGYFDGYENIPRADKYYDTATYTSVVHNAGINSPIYDIFETDYNANGQTTSFYVRSGITEANCRSDTWYQAINGYATTGLGNYQFTQFKVNMSTGDITISPIVNAVKQNYSGNTTVIDAPQAGIWYKNRYWISSASQAHSYNDEFLLKDRNGAWTRYVYKDSKGDWAANCFTLYQDRFLCGDSRYAIIWELETGNNDNGDIIPFYYYTKPLNFGLAGYRKNIVGANASSKGDTATLSYSCDDDLHWTNVVIPYNRNLTNNILTLYNIPYFKIIQFLISGETLNPWFIRDIFLYYSSSERPQQ